MMDLTLKKLVGMMTGREMTCTQVGKVLQHYLDGELDERAARRLAHHLEHCQRCGLEADTYERIKASLAQHRTPVPPDAIARLREFSERLTDEGIDDAP